MLIAKNNLREEFNTLFEKIKSHALQGKLYTDIYKLLGAQFSGTRQQFYALYMATEELKNIQKNLDAVREKQVVEFLHKGKKISHISQELNLSRSVIYDKARKNNIDVDKKMLIKKISADVFVPKKIHDAIPERQNQEFAEFLYQNTLVTFAHDKQCLNIFPAIDTRGDYWCGNYRDSQNQNKQSSRYCKECQKIVFSKSNPKIIVF